MPGNSDRLVVFGFLSSGKSCLHGLFPFSNKYAIKLWQICACPLAGSLCGWMTKKKNRINVKNFFVLNQFCAYLRLMFNFQYALLVDSTYSLTGLRR